MTFEEFYKSVENYKRLRPVIFKLEHDKSVGDQQIFDAEKEYGIVFPDSYKCLLKSIGGGYFGYTVMYSLDDEGFFNIRNHVTPSMVNEIKMLPVIDFETGDLLGYDINNNTCTERIVIWLHEEHKKKELDMDIYEALIAYGMKNNSLWFKMFEYW